LPSRQVPVTLNSVELGKTDLLQDGRIRLDLSDSLLRDLERQRLNVRVTVERCPPEVKCGPGGCRISQILLDGGVERDHMIRLIEETQELIAATKDVIACVQETRPLDRSLLTGLEHVLKTQEELLKKFTGQ